MSSLDGYLVVLRQGQVSDKVLVELAERSVGGVLVLMASAANNASERASWRRFERTLVSRAFAFPIYFVPHTVDAAVTSALLAAAASASGSQQLTVELPKRPANVKVDAVEPTFVTNIHVIALFFF